MRSGFSYVRSYSRQLDVIVALQPAEPAAHHTAVMTQLERVAVMPGVCGRL